MKARAYEDWHCHKCGAEVPWQCVCHRVWLDVVCVLAGVALVLAVLCV